jgi:hypothetical protein
VTGDPRDLRRVTTKHVAFAPAPAG